MNRRKLLLSSLLLIIFLFGSIIISWDLLYEHPKYRGCIPENIDRGCAIIATHDGGYLIAGMANSKQAWLIKTDREGGIVWSKSFFNNNSFFDSIFEDVVESRDGGYIAVGSATYYPKGSSVGKWYCTSVKVDGEGNLVWSKVYGNLNGSFARAITQARTGGYMLAGSIEINNSTGFDILLIKINENGNVIWNKSYRGSGNEQAFDVIQAIGGGYIVLSVNVSRGSESICLIKVDEDGDIVWNKKYKGWGSSIIRFNDNGYVIAGITSWTDQNPAVLLIKVDEYGDLIWNKTYRVGNFSWGTSLINVNDGFLVLGINGRDPLVDRDVLLMKVNDNGEVLWNKTYDGGCDDAGYNIIHALDGGYIIVGETASFGADGRDVLLMKVDEDGDLVWVRTYSGVQDKGSSDSSLPVELSRLLDFRCIRSSVILCRSASRYM